MLVILKIPVVYLGLVVWWAIRGEPGPLEGATLAVEPDAGGPQRWRQRAFRPRRPHEPHGSPRRSYHRTRRAALARAEIER